MKKAKSETKSELKIKTIAEKNSRKEEEFTYTEGDDTLTMKLYPNLSFTNRTQMVREIVNGVFMGDRDSIDAYVPEFLTFIRKLTVIKYFTDLELPTDINEAWVALNHTKIYERVIEAVGEDEVNSIFSDADKAIDTYRQYLVEKSDFNLFLSKISKMLGKFEDSVSKENIESMISMFKDMPKSASLQEVLSKITDNKDDKA